MITTVTLNAAIDKTYSIPLFAVDRLNRIEKLHSEPGGKGINVAKVLKSLGIPVTVTGFVGGFNGEYICQRLDRMGIEHQLVKVEAESRLCINVIDQERGTQTEILEPGPTITNLHWELLKNRVGELAEQSEVIVFSGSLPRGAPVDAYFQLIDLSNQKGTKTILDSSGEAFTAALAAQPFMVKPNREELAAYLHKPDISRREIWETMQRWHAAGIPLVVVSLGSEGAFVSDRGQCYQVIPPSVQAVNPVGSGDPLVAGLTAGLYLQLGMEETLILATAAAVANALSPVAGQVDIGQVEALKQRVRVAKISL
jgi:tagatose 6-phosphate kinase